MDYSNATRELNISKHRYQNKIPCQYYITLMALAIIITVTQIVTLVFTSGHLELRDLTTSMPALLKYGIVYIIVYSSDYPLPILGLQTEGGVHCHSNTTSKHYQ